MDVDKDVDKDVDMAVDMAVEDVDVLVKLDYLEYQECQE